jgi:hypothetical protein
VRIFKVIAEAHPLIAVAGLGAEHLPRGRVVALA